jgi:hypothetical protein
MIVNMNVYDQSMIPANSEVYLIAFKSIIDFDSLKPDVILAKMFPKILKQKHTLKSLITGEEEEFNIYEESAGKPSL